MPYDLCKINYNLGMVFSSLEIAKNLVKEYVVANKVNVWNEKNDKKRLVVKCSLGYPFYFRISLNRDKGYYQVKRIDVEYMCAR